MANPTECVSLSQPAFKETLAAHRLTLASYQSAGTTHAQLKSLIGTMLLTGSSTTSIASALIGAGYIKAGVTQTQVETSLDASFSDAVQKLNDNPQWSCCKDPNTGGWFGYHPTKGWDFLTPCG